MEMQNETLLDVMGMSCSSCVRHVSQALGPLPGVSKVEVQLEDGKVRVQHDPTQTPVQRLIEALDAAGYESTPSTAG